MIHRHCHTRIATLEAEVRAADRRATDAQAETARQRADAESACAARWDAAGEAEQLRERLSAANKRIRDLEQDRDDHEQVLAARRRRVAWAALDDATRRPWTDQSAHQAAVASALLALPLEHYDITPVYVNGRWRADGALAAGRHADRRDDERVLLEKYGITKDDLRAAEAQAATAA